MSIIACLALESGAARGGASFYSQGIDWVIVLGDALFNSERDRIASLAISFSLSISSRLAANSVASNEMPVAFPVGRARLDTIRNASKPALRS